MRLHSRSGQSGSGKEEDVGELHCECVVEVDVLDELLLDDGLWITLKPDSSIYTFFILGNNTP